MSAEVGHIVGKYVQLPGIFVMAILRTNILRHVLFETKWIHYY